MKDRLEVHLRERDELAHDIPTWEDLPFGGGDDYVKLDANAAHAIAGVLIEKGWRKPRTVTTTAELDALPVGSVVLVKQPEDVRGYSYQRGPSGRWFGAAASIGALSHQLMFPGSTATILFEGAR